MKWHILADVLRDPAVRAALKALLAALIGAGAALLGDVALLDGQVGLAALELARSA